MILYWLLKPIVFLITHTPRSIIMFIGKVLGKGAWIFAGKRRKIAIKNAEILGASDPVYAAKKSFEYTFIAYLETFYAPNVDRKFVEKYVSVEGAEKYKELSKTTTDIVFIGGHFGSWSMLAPLVYLSSGIKLITIGRSTKNKAFDKYLDELRTFEGVKYITHRGAMEKIGSYMAEGYHPGVYLDHIAPDKDCIYAPFCGYNIPTIAGIPALCIRKNYPVMFFFSLYDGKNIKVIIEGPIYPDTTLKPKERIYKLICDINKMYEKIYRKYPEQWYLLHKRFKRMQDDNGNPIPNIYEK